MAFSPICSAVYALGLVRLISRCYAVPPNRCLLVPGLPIPFGFPFVLALPVLSCITLFYWLSIRSVHVAPLCAYRPATSVLRLRHVNGLPSILTNNTSGISCHVCRFIRHISKLEISRQAFTGLYNFVQAPTDITSLLMHAVDVSRVITGYSLNIP